MGQKCVLGDVSRYSSSLKPLKVFKKPVEAKKWSCDFSCVYTNSEPLIPDLNNKFVHSRQYFTKLRLFEFSKTLKKIFLKRFF